MDIEAEIRDLKRRVGDLEGAYNVLTSRLRQTIPELSALHSEAQSRDSQFERTMMRLETSIDTVAKRFGSVELQVWSLRDDLPELIRAAVGKSVRSGQGGDATD